MNPPPQSRLRLLVAPVLLAGATTAGSYALAFYASRDKSYGLALFREQEERR